MACKPSARRGGGSDDDSDDDDDEDGVVMLVLVIVVHAETTSTPRIVRFLPYSTTGFVPAARPLWSAACRLITSGMRAGNVIGRLVP